MCAEVERSSSVRNGLVARTSPDYARGGRKSALGRRRSGRALETTTPASRSQEEAERLDTRAGRDATPAQAWAANEEPTGHSPERSPGSPRSRSLWPSCSCRGAEDVSSDAAVATAGIGVADAHVEAQTVSPKERVRASKARRAPIRRVRRVMSQVLLGRSGAVPAAAPSTPPSGWPTFPQRREDGGGRRRVSFPVHPHPGPAGPAPVRSRPARSPRARSSAGPVPQ